MRRENSRLILFLILGTFFSIPVFCIPFFNTFAATSPDALAIRVISNPEHYSAARWYQLRGFSGSPQSILVDGYEAVRDGRTVYVNAANIVGSTLYTNIYLISYNQDAEQQTMDIFGQVLSHWKFNSNINTPGNCSKTTGTKCLLDANCPLSEYCRSDKAEIIRDTKRLGDLRELKTLLANYKNIKGSYPKLNAGSYLQQKTLSTWPSWQKVLAQELGFTLPIDPINILGDCGDSRFYAETCWDEKKKEFAGAVTATSITLPANSHIMAYTTNEKGLTYTVCAVMESGLVSGAGSGNCDSTQEVKITETKANGAPVFANSILPAGNSGSEYAAFISASDPDGDTLTWSINTAGSTWTGWSSPPSLEPTAIPGQKKVYASKSGGPGTYMITVTIDDGRGEPNSVTTQIFDIGIGNQPPQILAPSMSYVASSTKTITYTFTATDDNLPITITLAPPLPTGLSGTPSMSGDTLTYTITGIFSPANAPVYPAKNYTFDIVATDALSQSSTRQFSLNWNNNRPVLKTPIICPTLLRAGDPFPGCSVTATDPDNNIITAYNITGITGITADISGNITGTAPPAGNYSPQITAEDEYGAESLPGGFNLRVTSFCGDGVKQLPNDERKGGPINNGVEECDGTDGVAGTPAQSSNSKQYECTAGCSGTSCAGTCSYTGGWCGDNATQTAHGEQCEKPGTGSGTNDQYNCTSDCQWTGGYCGDTTKNGTEQCDQNDGIAASPFDSSIFKQYQCSAACKQTGGYCEDGTTQTAFEECELADIATNPSESAINKQYDCDYCEWAGGYCGNLNTDLLYGETCDTPFPTGTGPYDQYVCANGCVAMGGWCGDSTWQSVYEDCEPFTVASSPSTSGPNKQYGCTNCNWSGGYCGDGTLQSAKGELCDGGDFGGLTCADFGFGVGGNLTCKSDCTIDTSTCCKYTFSDGTTIPSGSKDLTFTFQTGPFGVTAWVNGISRYSSYLSFTQTMNYGYNVVDMLADNGSCDSCGCNPTYGQITTAEGNTKILTDASQWRVSNIIRSEYCANVVPLGGGFIDTACCGNCCYMGFSTAIYYQCGSSACGNGIVERGEQCDGSSFMSGYDDCDFLYSAPYGTYDGSVSCTGSCTVDTSGCTLAIPPF